MLTTNYLNSIHLICTFIWTACLTDIILKIKLTDILSSDFVFSKKILTEFLNTKFRSICIVFKYNHENFLVVLL